MRPSVIIITITAIAIILIVGFFLLNEGANQPIQPGALNQSDERIIVTADKNAMVVGNDVSGIHAQLYYKGVPDRRSGVNINFTSDNDGIGWLSRNIEGNRVIATDDNGISSIVFNTNTSLGMVKIMASCTLNNTLISNNTYIDVKTPSSIAGLALDKNNKGVPNANVSFWICEYDNSTGNWDNIEPLPHPLNSQYSADGRAAPTGLFSLYWIPSGVYNVSVDIKGHLNYIVVNADEGTVTCIVSLPDYEYNGTTRDIVAPSPIDKGVIWGIIVDQNKAAINNAEVSLWRYEYNPETGKWENKEMVNIPDNPQISSNDETGKGTYKFYNIPAGTYNITVSYMGNIYYAIAHLQNNNSLNFITVHSPQYTKN